MENDILFTFFGVCLIGLGLGLFYSIAKMRKWLVIDARLIRAELIRRSSNLGGVSGQYFVPFIEFEYVVSGNLYKSNKFSRYNFSFGSETDLRDIVGEVVVGQKIKAYYNPKSIGQAVLHIPGYSVAISIVCSGCFVLFLTALFETFKK